MSLLAHSTFAAPRFEAESLRLKFWLSWKSKMPKKSAMKPFALKKTVLDMLGENALNRIALATSQS